MPSRRESGTRPGSRPGGTRPGTGRGRDGTAKRRTTSAPAGTTASDVAEPDQDGPAEPKRSLTGRAAVVLLVLGALVVSYAQSLRVWFDQHQQISSLQNEIRDREQRVGQLQDEMERWNDEAYVRAQARQRLGWVMPGQVGYRVIGADGKPLGAPPAPSGTAAATQDPTWYSKLWGSVLVSGTKPQAQQQK